MGSKYKKAQVWTLPNKTEKNFESDKSLKISRNWSNFWIVDALKGYCNSTGLHGFHYITWPAATDGERLFWIIVVFIGLCVSLILLVISWNWNTESLTVTVIESSHFPTWHIPFPAVSACNFNKISRRKAMQYARSLKKPANMTANELAQLFVLLLGFIETTRHKKEDYSKLDAILDENQLSTVELYEKLAPDCNELLVRCVWKGTLTRCDMLFQTINSSMGVCCSFNYYGTEQNTYSAKVAHTVPKKPRRVTASGYLTGLTVLLNPIPDDYFASFLSGYGFLIFINSAYDYPGLNAEAKLVSSKTENFISITPEATYSTPDVLQLSPRERDCLFPKEKKMEVMKFYSYINCLAECRSRLFFEICGCVPLGFTNNATFPPCRMEALDCVTENKKLITGALPGFNKTAIPNKRTAKYLCGCLPDCKLNQYPPEIATGILDREFAYNSKNLFKNVKIKDEIIVHVYFNDLISTRHRKDIYQTWVSLLASFGGLLGLIIGFSLVAAFELGYYLILRPLFEHFSAVIARRRSKIKTEEFTRADKF